jgi:hypothetical protein
LEFKSKLPKKSFFFRVGFLAFFVRFFIALVKRLSVRGTQKRDYMFLRPCVLICSLVDFFYCVFERFSIRELKNGIKPPPRSRTSKKIQAK